MPYVSIAGLLNSPLRFAFGMNSAAWSAAVQSLEQHWDNAKLKRPFLMTLIDFSIPSKAPRLWTFNIVLHVPYIHTFVAHGLNSGGYMLPATKFSNVKGTKQSCLGGFATYHRTHKSNLGKVSGTGLRVHGLDAGVNDKAMTRGIVFHGASYVEGAHRVARSWGCFATIPQVNEQLLPLISGGSFVYAWGG